MEDQEMNKNNNTNGKYKNKKKIPRRRSKYSIFLDKLPITEEEIDDFLSFENWYDHYHAENIMKHHLYLYKKAQSSKDDRGILDFVVGDYNTGKSTMENQWIFDMRNSRRYKLKPKEVIYFEVPPGTKSDKLLFAKLLEKQFGEGLTEKELKKIKTVEILDRLIQCFKENNTKIVILDEIQLLLKNPLNKRIFDNLKYLLNFTKWGVTPVKTNWVLCGTKDSKKLLKIDKWIHERANVLELKHYEFQNPRDKKEIRDFITMIYLDWTECNWFDQSEWDLIQINDNKVEFDFETISILHQLSAGKVGKLYQILKKAGYWALLDGRRYITRDDYAQGVLIHEKEVKSQRQKEKEASKVEIDNTLTDNSILQLQIDESMLNGICIFCKNGHRQGKRYSGDNYLSSHYAKEHPEQVSDINI